MVSIFITAHLLLFGNEINQNKLVQINEYFYSPAEIINIYMSNKNEEDFMARILLNKKVFTQTEEK